MERFRKGEGFTAIELVLMMAVAGVLAVAAVPQFPNVASFRLEGAAKKLTNDLAYARLLARTRNGTYGVSFSVAGNSYTVFSFNPVTNIETPLTDPHGGGPMVVDLDQVAGLSGVALLGPNFGETSTVRFAPTGVPTDGNGVALAAAGTVVLAVTGATRTVQVEPNTGGVSVQ